MAEVSAEAKGHLLLSVRIALTAAASPGNIDKLIRAGGWKISCINNAVSELNVLIEAYVKEFSAGFEIEELSSEKMTEYLKKRLPKEANEFGLEIVSISTQSIDPKDSEIIIALQQKEEARIKEQTEHSKQKARTSMAKAKALADEQIILAEHELEMKKLELKKTVEDSESRLAEKRVTEELQRKKLQLEFEKKEMELLKNNPELLMLSPQLARLAEASQQLPNAKTVVSLSQGDLQKGSQLIETIQGILQGVFGGKSVIKKDSK
jgi:regulator of protease activity HflC (stomatin/prohibitin superfamily)